MNDLITALINDAHTLVRMYIRAYICIHMYVYVCTLFPPNTCAYTLVRFNASKSPTFSSIMKH